MASYNHNGSGTDDRKLSGFSKRNRVSQASDNVVADNGRLSKGRGKVMLGRRGDRWWISLLVDMALLLVLAGLIVGAVFGYRALRDLYAPVWETREVVFCVEMKGIDPELVKYGKDGRPTIVNNSIWSSDLTDADHLGIVTDVRSVLVPLNDGTNTLTLYLTVEANAYYRLGKGYRMGETMLLAGYEGVFRLESLSAQGSIISMHEKQDEVQTTGEAETAVREPDMIDPDAQG